MTATGPNPPTANGDDQPISREYHAVAWVRWVTRRNIEDEERSKN
jgi:hypothetical protein